MLRHKIEGKMTMRSNINAFIVSFLFMQSSVLAIAQETGTKAPTTDVTGSSATHADAAPINDKTNYLGDKIKFQTDMYVEKVDMKSKNKDVSPACVPAFSTLRGIGTLKVGADTRPAFIITNVEGGGSCDDKKVRVNDVVLVKLEDLNSTPPDRYGLTYGALLVPFKYHLGGSKSFTGSTSVGGYLGFRQDRSGRTGLALEYIGFIGAATVPVAQTTNGQSTTQNMSGVTYGIGILGTVKGSFHMGVVFGADRVNASAHYEDNGKPWVAVEIGYAFSN